MNCKQDYAIVLGLNSRRVYDTDFGLFLNALRGHIEVALARIADTNEAHASYRTQVDLNAQNKFQRFAENAPVGIYMYDGDGVLTFCNKVFREITGMTMEDLAGPMAFVNAVHPDSVDSVSSSWAQLAQGVSPVVFDVQFRKPWARKIGDNVENLDRTWEITSSITEVSDTGQLIAVLGCVTDISYIKWAEQIQVTRLAEVIDAKVKQEKFLDMTSHELRNPLSAIMHCANELTDDLVQLSDCITSTSKGKKRLQDALELVSTVSHCCKHLKRIADDVLTLSKLDARLLHIQASSIDPTILAKEALEMFSAELRTTDISHELIVMESYRDLGVTFARFDQLRITQVLVNLIANAIKFLRTMPNRHLQLIVDASLTEPVEGDMDIHHMSSISQHLTSDQIDWTAGKPFYLSFSIRDSGVGIKQEDIALLSHRFSQAPSRTHTQYEGSGLGLYICKELVSLHGGRIGLESQPGEGSTFTFYIKAGLETKVATVKSDVTQVPSRQDDTRIIYSPHEQERQDDRLTPKLGTQKSSIGSPDSHRPPRVLVVEDNLINQTLLKKMLIKRGYEVAVANHGQEALEILANSAWNTNYSASADGHNALSFDAILCDIEMPVMDGRSTIKYIRELQQKGELAARIPAIAVSANAREAQVKDIIDCGFDAMITKPYKISDLLKTLAQCTALQ